MRQRTQHEGYNREMGGDGDVFHLRADGAGYGLLRKKNSYPADRWLMKDTL